MQSDRRENSALRGIAVAILTEHREQQLRIQNRVEATGVARIVFSHPAFPLTATDSIIRQIQDQRTEVVVVDLHSENLQRALDAIELIQDTTSDIAIFAIGEISSPMNIVAAMRAGACEYVDRQASNEYWLDAFERFAAARTKKHVRTRKTRVFTVINAKGGSGATTVAVNTAVALQRNHGQTVLIDFAPIGHAALHLNLRPSFGILDALKNLHRMDTTLLDGMMTPATDGLHLLAGPQQPEATAATTAELARLFHLLVGHYRYVVVDCSSRMDNTTRLLADLSHKVLLVAPTDVVSLWSAGRIRTFLEEDAHWDRRRLRLVLNRYKKIPGFTNEDVEKATGIQILWKLPNDYQLVAPAIDRGEPVAAQKSSDLSRSFRSLATLLATDDDLGGTGGSVPPGESAPPAVPVRSPRSGGPLTLPPRKAAWET
jgi:pilus assembly protein CpaE